MIVKSKIAKQPHRLNLLQDVDKASVERRIRGLLEGFVNADNGSIAVLIVEFLLFIVEVHWAEQVVSSWE